MPDRILPPEVTEDIRALLTDAGVTANQDLVARIIATGVGLGLDDTDRLDLKITSAALTEMRAAFRLFAPYRDVSKVTIFGSARTRPDDALYRAAVDVAAALAANLRMIRGVAEVYGGRSGTLGAWRLVRTVMTHLVATGAVAVGDDLLHGVAGGTVLSRLSRRFGEGVVNGALTARVGVAAIEVCRPLPFAAREKPTVTGILGTALRGLFGRD